MRTEAGSDRHSGRELRKGELPGDCWKAVGVPPKEAAGREVADTAIFQSKCGRERLQEESTRKVVESQPVQEQPKWPLTALGPVRLLHKGAVLEPSRETEVGQALGNMVARDGKRREELDCFHHALRRPCSWRSVLGRATVVSSRSA